MKNSGLANFIPEMCLAFAQISSIHQKMASKSWSCYYIIKDGFEEMEREFTFWNIPSWKTGLAFQLLLPDIFCWNDPKNLVPLTFQPDFPKMFCKWWTTSISISSLYHLIQFCCLLEQRKFTKQSLSFSEWPKNMTWSFYIQRLSTTFSERSQVNQLPCSTKWKR